MRTKRSVAKKSSDDQFMAAAIGDVEWLRQSLRGPQQEVCFDRNGLAPIHLAALHGRLECLRLLVETCKCDVNLASSTGWRPIHLCISNQTGKRSFQCLLYLLEKGAQHTVLNDDMTTPVHQAASEGHLQALELLMKLGAQIDTEDSRGYLPIDLAKIWGHKKCARVLATEMWHRDKDEIAKKMHMKKRTEMKAVLKEFEEQERLTDDMKYKGNEAYDEWAANIQEFKQERAKPKPVLQTKQSLAEQYRQDIEDMDSQHSDKESPHRPPVHQESKVPKDKRQDADQSLTRKASDILSREELDSAINSALNSASKAGTEKRAASRKSKHDGTVFHPSDWNFSGRVSICFHPYMTKLKDAYPRDEFTLMPHPRKSFPQALNVLSKSPAAVLDGEPNKKLIQKAAKERNVEDDDEVETERTPRADPNQTPHARKDQLFKCRTIQDVQTKKRIPELVQRYRGEAALHLIEDPSSFLFQDALVSEFSLPVIQSGQRRSAQLDALIIESGKAENNRSSLHSKSSSRRSILSAHS